MPNYGYERIVSKFTENVSQFLYYENRREARIIAKARRDIWMI